MSAITRGAMDLLDFIAVKESGGDYNIVYGGIKPQDRPSKGLTNMTIREVLAWQDSIDARYPSEASGKYQIMEDTLRGLYGPAGVPLNMKFDEFGQDTLGHALLERRGWSKYLAGDLTATQFAQNLSQEWASLPAITRDKKGRAARGQSYYAGDGLNRAHRSIDETLEAVIAAKGAQAGSVHTKPKSGSKGKAAAGVLVAVSAGAATQWDRITGWFSMCFGG